MQNYLARHKQYKRKVEPAFSIRVIRWPERIRLQRWIYVKLKVASCVCPESEKGLLVSKTL